MLEFSVDDLYPVMPLEYDLLRLMPVAIFHGTLQVRPVVSVEVLEYSVLITQSSVSRLPWRRTILNCG